MPVQDYNEVRRERRKALRDTWLQENGPCVACGSTQRLEVDHIKRTDKETHRVWSMSAERRAEELRKCQVLCFLCHKQKTKEEAKALAQHGKRTMYKKHKCRCASCKEWKRIDSKLYRARKNN